MENIKPKIFIFTTCYHSMTSMQYTVSLLKLITFFNSKSIPFVIDFIGDEIIMDKIRNESIAKFMNSSCTHLLFINSDISFEIQAVMDLLLYDKDVVCCNCPEKKYNWEKIADSIKNEKNSIESIESRGIHYSYIPIYDKEKQIIKNNNFIKVKYASADFMLIKKNIIERLWDKHQELMIICNNTNQNNNLIIGLFCSMIKGKDYLSGDYSFCERVNDIGGEIWMNINHNLNRLGENIFCSDIKNRNYLERNGKE